MKSMTLRLEDDQAESLRQLSFVSRHTQSDILRSAVGEYLTRHMPTRPRPQQEPIRLPTGYFSVPTSGAYDELRVV